MSNTRGVLNKDGTYDGPRIAYAVCANHDKLDKPLMFNIINVIMQGPLEWVLVHQGKHIKSSSLNKLVEYAYDHQCTHILFMDVDMEFPRNVVQKLLSHGLPIVSGLYHTKSYPFSPVAGWNITLDDGTIGRANGRGLSWKYDYYPLPEDQLVEVDWTGIGCLLVDMDVFNKIPFPCFRDDWDDEKGERARGHDLYFCDTAKEHGYKVYVDTSVSCGHRMVMTVDKLWVDAFHNSNIRQITTELLKSKSDGRDSHKSQLQSIASVEKHRLIGGLPIDNPHEVNSREYWDEKWKALDRNHVIIDRDTIYKAIKDRIGDNESVADVGSGYNTLPFHLKDQKHCDVTIYDLSESCVKRMIDVGFSGKAVDVTTYSPNGESFSTVVCSHLLEHIRAKDVPNLLTILSKLTQKQCFVIVPQDRKKYKEQRRIYTASKLRKTLEPYFGKVAVEKIKPSKEDKELFVNRHLIAHCVP